MRWCENLIDCKCTIFLCFLLLGRSAVNNKYMVGPSTLLWETQALILFSIFVMSIFYGAKWLLLRFFKTLILVPSIGIYLIVISAYVPGWFLPFLYFLPDAFWFFVCLRATFISDCIMDVLEITSGVRYSGIS